MDDVIIVDSDISERSQLNQLLSLAGYNSVYTYPSTKMALNHFSGKDFHKGIVFLTVRDGFEALAYFLEILRSKTQEACVIMTVGTVTNEEVRSIVQLGVDQILVRPFNTQLLLSKIAAAEDFRRQVIQESLSRPRNSPFEAKADNITEKFYKVNISGWLTENCSLPEILPATKDNTLYLQCDFFRGINSVGIRLWIMWLKDLAANKGFIRFELDGVQPAILQQINTVQGFIPDNASINSFYLDYWCEDNDQEKKFKFVRGKDYSTSKMRIPLKREEIENGQKMIYTLDNPIVRVLKFYKGQIETIDLLAAAT